MLAKECVTCKYAELDATEHPCSICDDYDRWVSLDSFTPSEYISQLEFDLLEQKKLTDLLFNRCYNLHERLRKLEKENKK